MQDFEYSAPRTLGEAVSLMAEKGQTARALAGGTDILVQLRGGRWKVEHVVDVKEIPELNEISFSREDGLTLGAAVPCYRIYQDPEVAQAYPGVIDAALMIGGDPDPRKSNLGRQPVQCCP